MEPAEEGKVQLLLEPLDLPADRGLRHAELARRLGEAQVARGRLEHDERGHRGEAAPEPFHELRLYQQREEVSLTVIGPQGFMASLTLRLATFCVRSGSPWPPSWI